MYLGGFRVVRRVVGGGGKVGVGSHVCGIGNGKKRYVVTDNRSASFVSFA